MEVTGRIILDIPMVTGTSRTGNPWKKKEYVLETHDQYPRKVHFGFFGDRCDQYPLKAGEEVTISFDLESREFNGRWYTDVRAWKAERAQAPQAAAPVPPTVGAPVPPPAAAYPSAPAAPAAPADLGPQSPADDLPF